MYGRLMQNAAVYSAFLSVSNRLHARIVYRQPYFTIRALLERAESGEDISSYLASRLARVLRIAVDHVPYYKSLGLGIAREDIGPDTAYEVLSRFPYLEKSAVMESPESFVSGKYRVQTLTSETSGGSTGQGIRIYRNASLVSAEAGFFHHAWGKVGFVRGARVVRMAFEGRKAADDEPCSRSGDRLLVSPYHFNERWIGRIYSDIKAFEPQFFHAYPNCFEYLADYMNRSNLCLPGLVGIFLASERVTQRTLDLADAVFAGVPVVFHYGLAERTNLAWGFRREDGISYKFERAYGHSENLTHGNGAQEIVGTSYWNELMPLIRYRTQDYGEIRDGVVGGLEGREQEFLVTRTGTRIPGICVEIDDFTWDYAEGVQVVQKERGKVEFRVKPRAEYTAAIGERIVASQQLKWGDYFDITLTTADHLERTPSGKMRRYVVELSESPGQE